jgi:hypothetical protein
MRPLLTGTGEKMDLASCVDAVLAATRLSDASPGLSEASPGLSDARP